ncbi:hypothetical protein K7432_014261 [Basidiobolus ranarum]|uniref:GHMP kinase N-terminal domain-containing protein n=1 Tax=Basidiobolus ranarum TaxID=34480 RepID=A0ABR2WHV3_9FUNG
MTVLIILATKLETHLEKDIKTRYDPISLKFRGLPKALLPISGDSTITRLYKVLGKHFNKVYVVTNAHNYKIYERWAYDHHLHINCVVNNGVVSLENIDPRADVEFVVRVRNIQEAIFVVESNHMAIPDDLENMLDIIKSENENILFCEPIANYDLHKSLRARKFYFNTNTKHLVDIIAHDRHIKDPGLSQVIGCVSGYYITQEALQDIVEQTKNHERNRASMEEILPHSRELYQQLKVNVKIIENPLVGWKSQDMDFNEYFNLWYNALIDNRRDIFDSFEPVTVKTYARVGLMGNPSDGYFGKTLSLTIGNFWATAILLPKSSYEPFARGVEICFNSLCDPLTFESLHSLSRVCKTDGYQGAYQLVLATCKVFWTYCKRNRINLPRKAGFRILYETNIPRQVGLAGSSAIITSLLKALMMYYNVEDKIPTEIQPTLILAVERDELNLNAGLQDRVVQTYGGLVYMDFDQKHMVKNHYGIYQTLPLSSLPSNMYLAYLNKSESSGAGHSSVRARWDAGDREVVEAMSTLASYAEQAKNMLMDKKLSKLPALMTSNFQLRRKIHGDAVIGSQNLRMIEIAEGHGFAAKFAGSGGAIIMLYKQNVSDPNEERLAARRLENALQMEDFVFCKIVPTHND